MSYHTHFDGRISITPALTPTQVKKLRKFIEARHDDSATKTYPAAWCFWKPSTDGLMLFVDEDDIEDASFYNYTEWLQYLIEHFFKGWGCVLNGQVRWEGEESQDTGIIYVKNNQVEEVADEYFNPGPSWDRQER